MTARSAFKDWSPLQQHGGLAFESDGSHNVYAFYLRVTPKCDALTTETLTWRLYASDVLCTTDQGFIGNYSPGGVGSTLLPEQGSEPHIFSDIRPVRHHLGTPAPCGSNHEWKQACVRI